MQQYKIDGKMVFDPANPAAQKVLVAYRALAESVNQPPRFLGFESSDSLRRRLGNQRIITDDNMGMEWNTNAKIYWH
jgi:hypothetical protein